MVNKDVDSNCAVIIHMNVFYISLKFFFNTGLPELEKVVVMPFVRKADDIDLSGIPNRYFVSSFGCCR